MSCSHVLGVGSNSWPGRMQGLDIYELKLFVRSGVKKLASYSAGVNTYEL